MNLLSYAGPATFSTPPRRFVLWVLPAGEWRMSYYYKAVRAALRFVSVIGILDDTIPVFVLCYYSVIYTQYVWKQPRSGCPLGSGFGRATWIYYSRNISTTTTTH